MDENILRLAADKHKSDILEPYDVFMHLHGYDAVSTLCKIFGGGTVYIPSLRTIFKRCLEREVILEFNGANYGELARKYGFSERQIRNIVNNTG